MKYKNSLMHILIILIIIIIIIILNKSNIPIIETFNDCPSYFKNTNNQCYWNAQKNICECVHYNNNLILNSPSNCPDCDKCIYKTKSECNSQYMDGLRDVDYYCIHNNKCNKINLQSDNIGGLTCGKDPITNQNNTIYTSLSDCVNSIDNCTNYKSKSDCIKHENCGYCKQNNDSICVSGSIDRPYCSQYSCTKSNNRYFN